MHKWVYQIRIAHYTLKQKNLNGMMRMWLAYNIFELISSSIFRQILVFHIILFVITTISWIIAQQPFDSLNMSETTVNILYVIQLFWPTAQCRICKFQMKIEKKNFKNSLEFILSTGSRIWLVVLKMNTHEHHTHTLLSNR